MQRENLNKTFKLTKNRLEEDNKQFIDALDKKIGSELKFQAYVARIAKCTQSFIDVVQLRGELKRDGDGDNDSSGDSRNDLMAMINLRQELVKEMEVSRKRSETLETFSNEIRRYFGIEQDKEILVADSSPECNQLRQQQTKPGTLQLTLSTDEEEFLGF